MFANSSQPTPKDDDDIILNFQDMGVEPATLIFPAIYLFSERPTLKNAKTMLCVYKIHLPLSTLLIKKQTTNYTQNKTYMNANVNANKANDIHLAAVISNWMQSSLDIVLDDFVIDLKQGGGGQESKGTFTLIGCAYLIVLLANMKRLNDQMIKTTSNRHNITFIDGFFMNRVDNYVSKFLTLFCKTVKRLTNFTTNVVYYTGDKTPIARPQYFKQIYGANTFQADIAVETGSIYMTHDRLAHMYYKLIGGQHGFLLTLDEVISNHVSRCNYSVKF